MAITSANQLELLQTAEAVAREKMIDPDLVVEAMEESRSPAPPSSRYGAEMDIRVSIDRKTGRATFTRVRTVVPDDELENYQAELTVEQAKEFLDDPKIGDEIRDEVPPGRDGPDRRAVGQAGDPAEGPRGRARPAVRRVQGPRRHDHQRRRQARGIRQRHRRYRPGRGHPAPQREDRPRKLSPGDRIRCYIKDVRREARGPQMFLSRTAPSSWPSSSRWKCRRSTTASSRSRPWPATPARAPRSRSSPTIRRSIRWAPASACAAAACRPSSTSCRARRSTSSPGTRTADLPRQRAAARRGIERSCSTRRPSASRSWCPTSSCRLAIGRRGQNVRLASQLTGLDIDIMTEAEESGAPSGRVRRAHQAVHRHARPGRVLRAASGGRGVHQPRRSRLCRAGRADW